MRFCRHVVACVLVASLHAQQPSSFAALAVPSGVNTAGLLQLGKLVIYTEGSTLHVFSSFTREWHSTPLPFGAQIRHTNDWVVVEDGTSYTAFSSMRGTFETIAVSAGAFIVNPAVQRNDSILLVRDGATLHAFSGFVGQWVQKPIAPGAVIAVERQVAVVVEGTTISGMSSYDSVWVSQTVPSPPSTVHAEGTVAWAADASTIWGFSAQTQTWSSAPALAPTAVAAGAGDVAAWADGTGVLGFSGLTGRFDRRLLPGQFQLTAEQQLVAATAPAGTALFSAMTGRWTWFVTLTQPRVEASAATALLIEQNAVHAYSALTDSVATLLLAAPRTEVNWTLAVAVDASNTPRLFSAFTGRWLAVPASPLGLLPLTSFQTALVHTTAGYAAFSARTGNLELLPGTIAGTPHVNPNSGLVAIEMPQSLHLFDARRDAWVHQALAAGGPPLGVEMWRTSFIAVQGQRCFGFGSQLGEIETFDLPEPAVQVQASSESVSIATAGWLVAYSPSPDLLPLAQFPEFRRVFADGTTLELQLRGEPGAAAAVLIGAPMKAGVPLSLGTFFLSPATMAVLWSSVVPAEGTAVLRNPMPAGLRGLEIGFQAGLLPAGGAYLSRLSTVSVL